jgi:hypothetical protein
LLTGADLLNAVQREMKKDQSFRSACLNITVIQGRRWQRQNKIDKKSKS